MTQKFYITTAIPYVNGRPHIGHALEYLLADAIYRYHKLSGNDARIVSGADENALKNIQAAEKENLPVQEFLDKNSKMFQEFYKFLNIELDEFRRGTDKALHWPGVQELWKLADKAGDIYKKKYKGLYCVGSESFVAEKDLREGGLCPDHDEKPILVEEENYFFKLSKYQKKLEQLVDSDSLKIHPEKRKNEVLSFIRQGLEDFSISRSNERAKGIGVPVPNDDSQKMYVWFDALTIYMTGTGWGYNQKLWERYWPAELHVIGKDIIRFHAVYWPAMLMSAGLPLPKAIFVHGFITSGGVKMSKSKGNVIDPYQIIESYGLDATRYYLLAKIPSLDDGDFTLDSFEQAYQADLANGLGNLVSRIAAMAKDNKFAKETLSISQGVKNHMQDLNPGLALENIWREIRETDEFISKNKVWEQTGSKKQKSLDFLVNKIRQISIDLAPFLPETSQKITKQFSGTKIVPGKPLFPRLK